MERKTAESYSLILAQFQTICEENHIVVLKVVSDFEAAIRLAVHETLPNTAIVGCQFHYARAVYMNFKKMGLVRNSTDEKIVACRMAMCISLLPQEYFNDAIEIIRCNFICLAFFYK